MEVRLQSTFLKQEYQDDLLVTDTLSGDTAPRVIAIPPMLSPYNESERIEVKAPRLTYDWLCSCVLILDGGEPVDIMAAVERVDKNRPVHFTWKQSLLPDPSKPGGVFPTYSSSINVSIQRAYMDDITGQVSRHAKILWNPKRNTK
jgi:hypothetical protein